MISEKYYVIFCIVLLYLYEFCPRIRDELQFLFQSFVNWVGDYYGPYVLLPQYNNEFPQNFTSVFQELNFFVQTWGESGDIRDEDPLYGSSFYYILYFELFVNLPLELVYRSISPMNFNFSRLTYELL